MSSYISLPPSYSLERSFTGEGQECGEDGRVIKPDLREFSLPLYIGIQYLPLALRLQRSNRRHFLGRKEAEAQHYLPPLRPFKRNQANLRPSASLSCPIGGVGCGYMPRDTNGHFRRLRLQPIEPETYRNSVDILSSSYFSVFVRRCSKDSKKGGRADYSTVLFPGSKCPSVSRHLKSWEWKAGRARHYASYPRAWHYFDDLMGGDVAITIQQLSPVIAHNYAESSLPCCVFLVNVENKCSDPIDVTVLLTFQVPENKSIPRRGAAKRKDSSPSCVRCFSASSNGSKGVPGGPSRAHVVSAGDSIAAVEMACPGDIPLNLGLSVQGDTDAGAACDFSITGGDQLSNKSTIDSLWGHLAQFEPLSELDSGVSSIVADKGEQKCDKTDCVALTATLQLEPQTSNKVKFSIAWDNPFVRFPSQDVYLRKYVSLWNSLKQRGEAGFYQDDRFSRALQISLYGLGNALDWEREIVDWHTELLAGCTNLSNRIKGAIVNELYFLTAGGSLWLEEAVLRDECERMLDALEPSIIYSSDCIQVPPIQSQDTAEEGAGHEGLRVDYKALGKFLYLEGSEYLMYNTVDVHFLASFGLLWMFPKLEMSLVRDIADHVFQANSESRLMAGDGHMAPRLLAGAVPHDLGYNAPWRSCNDYNLHDTSLWKDLDAKFVILCWRDYALAKDIVFAREVFEAVCAALHHLQSRLPPFSEKPDQAAEESKPKSVALGLESSYPVRTDGVLLKSDGGHPDNTYDIWAEEGQLVYVNGLYLTALAVSWRPCPEGRRHTWVWFSGRIFLKKIVRVCGTTLDVPHSCTERRFAVSYGEYLEWWCRDHQAGSKLAEAVGETEYAAVFLQAFENTKGTFEKTFWSGEYYLFSDSMSKNSRSIMSEGVLGPILFGQVSGLPSVIDLDNARKHFRLVFQVCLRSHGLVNGATYSGRRIPGNFQASEVWSGVSYAVAATMLSLGLVEEGVDVLDRTASIIYGGKSGFQFQTPEGWGEEVIYRSLTYMRPLSVVAVPWVLGHFDSIHRNKSRFADSNGGSPQKRDS